MKDENYYNDCVCVCVIYISATNLFWLEIDVKMVLENGSLKTVIF